MGRLLIRGGEVITSLDRMRSDIFCEDGIVRALGAKLEVPAATEVVDASGQLVFPGGLDPHVHMELPLAGTVSADDFESGTIAGICGGVTCIIDFCTPERGQSLLEELKIRDERSVKAVIDFSYHMAITWINEQVEKEMQIVREKGIPSFKHFLAYKGTVMLNDDELYRSFSRIKELGGIATVHAENGDIIWHLQQKLLREGKTGPAWHAASRPPAVEAEATNRAIRIAEVVGVPIYIVHLSSKAALEAVIAARLRGQRHVYAESLISHLVLDDSVYDKPDFEAAAYVMSPPFRPRGNPEALWAGIKAGMIQTTGTDHCPFNMSQKAMGKNDFTRIPNGCAAIEDRMSLLWHYGVNAGHISEQQFVDLFTTNACRLFGLYPRKGTIAVGSDADLVVFDPTKTRVISARTHHQKVDRNIFEGLEVKGVPTHVIANGKLVYKDGDLRAERGAGRFIPRAGIQLI
ncbi:MAG: dihydropyrimidinase [candidate division KSB1 bacterium]|nr:dihydropyrimidinase [candidate division KSB1 bacterium]MDZ7304789.1 dihydropyrimidinase [candidate division KSB1 bacterium]MDZ7313865.1 dihydropyrimidinase [candidate division KSB1 bacterium]